MKQGSVLYPFSAIVGQEKMKRALLINAIEPRVGGLLIKGERGTGKSTAARALAELLPDIEVVADCPFSCDPHDEDGMCSECQERWRRGEPLAVATRPTRFVTLPLNASEDRVVGTLDLERAVREGVKDFEPGVLADANRSILYVDEVNLLDDHIVDVLLDAAAMGVNVVEREGVSFSHPSRFIIIGTMNPEEGELRPQLEDRFGLCVEVSGESDPRDRVEVMRRRRLFLEDPRLLRAAFQADQEELRRRVAGARETLRHVEMPEEMMELVARIAVEMGVCGHRADIAICQAARALAALEGCVEVGSGHVREAAEMALLHRLRKTPFDEAIKDMERLDRIIARKGRPAALSLQDNLPSPTAPEIPEGTRGGDGECAPPSAGADRCAEASVAAVEVPALQGISARAARPATGKRSSAVTDSGNGRRIGHRMPRADEDGSASGLALDATLRAAAGRSAANEQPFAVRREDFRYAVRKRKVGNLVLFVVDASASMGCNERIEATKEAVSLMLTDAYRNRDRVGLISFRDQGAQLVLSPTSSVQLANLRVRELATGGATPLNHGLAMALQVAKRESRREPDIMPLLVFITDGQGNVGYLSDNPVRESLELAARIREEGFPCVVFDTSVLPSQSRDGRPLMSHARRIAEAMGAEYHRLAHPQPREMVDRLKRFL
ncbi:MAG: magnesium chelatase subunit D family protein [Actinobacteria bacterium]|nr:magnesium chelatase subunit D family protein [Actinomycetota bacterium]